VTAGCGADGFALAGPCESPWFAHVPRQASDMHTTIIESSRTKITRQSIRLVLYTLSFLNPIVFLRSILFFFLF
ncbi:MAG TPA: hypothetical protein DEF33_04650, partial [Clostridiales bacterium]|nr:hypothetical protein [Clostridiales bacterium]